MVACEAPGRAEALAAAIDAHGAQGQKIRGAAFAAALAASDLALFADPGWMEAAAAFAAMFAPGLEGYADDRLSRAGSTGRPAPDHG
ncbi:MAG TPA: hypothetical protein VH307_25655 [Streptosporangiaceae bacterium]|jgi:hypothetical protein|nr:hypothetical protein [Streptosporangiaceae bacterium]